MSYDFKKVLVTGGAGCIGMAVCDELFKRGVKVVLFDLYEQIATVKSYIRDGIDIFYGSILDETSIREAIRGCDGIVHLAAYLGVRRTELNSLRCLDININGTKKVLDAAVNANVKKIIFSSSSEVYGEPINNPITEDEITQGKTVYAVSKLASEELIKAYNAEHEKLEYTILRYFNTYGPYQIAQFVVPKFIRNVINGKPPVIYGSGKQERSYNYSDDTARATVDTLLSNSTNGEIMNIGNSDSLISLVDLGNLIIDICGKRGTLKVKVKNSFEGTDRSEKREIYQRYCSTEKAKRLINYEPKVSIIDGIKKVIETGVPQPVWATSEREYKIGNYE
ncbi:MAG: SDR family NAD(P)-dependent oxidoreductase [Candidatus Brocadiales bacterium]|nr:SDR family NAD(P)-dependent oxidoreductase [Candidatus Brocadiales bacterium]